MKNSSKIAVARLKNIVTRDRIEETFQNVFKSTVDERTLFRFAVDDEGFFQNCKTRADYKEAAKKIFKFYFS